MKIVKSLVLATILALAVNCSANKTTVANTASPATENSNATVQNSANSSDLAEDPAAGAQSVQAAPDAVVRDLYKVHDQDLKGSNDRILGGKSRASIDKYFDKTLADFIWKDLTTHKDEVGVLDFDPFYSAQDFDIKNFTYGQTKIDKTTATVPVSFTNFDSKDKLIYTLVQQNSAWKISDIKYTDGSTLLGYFKDDAKENAANSSDPKNKDTASSKTGNFEGTYSVGETTCTVKPIKMAYELKWAKGTGTMIFFSTGEENWYKFATEDKGKGIDAFVFNDASLTVGKFVRADGQIMAVKKIK